MEAREGKSEETKNPVGGVKGGGAVKTFRVSWCVCRLSSFIFHYAFRFLFFSFTVRSRLFVDLNFRFSLARAHKLFPSDTKTDSQGAPMGRRFLKYALPRAVVEDLVALLSRAFGSASNIREFSDDKVVRVPISE